jgi:RimJ/RimL family protein N-acetyltransferase
VGQGLATEIVGALVTWGRSQPNIGSVSAGVTEDNPASERVLVKNGFGRSDVESAERIYRRALDD